MQQSSATPSLHHSFWGLQKIVACSQSSSQCLLVSIVFGTVSSLHPLDSHSTRRKNPDLFSPSSLSQQTKAIHLLSVSALVEADFTTILSRSSVLQSSTTRIIG